MFGVKVKFSYILIPVESCFLPAANESQEVIEENRNESCCGKLRSSVNLEFVYVEVGGKDRPAELTRPGHCRCAGAPRLHLACGRVRCVAACQPSTPLLLVS